MDKIIVTRHPALVNLLIEKGLATEDTPVIDHATYADVMGKDVLGVLPLHLAAVANTVTEIPLKLTKELRNTELSLDTLRDIASEPRTYKVTVISKDA